jgi:predicted amidophosphoribosyltransferase
VIGFLAGLFLGPFVLLMLFADSGKKKCPACATWIPKEAKVCAQCRQEV